MQPKHYDVVIVGAGLAGLTLARQLLARGGLEILHLEKNTVIPSPRQKVGESNVQIQGYYLGKVLDLEEYLFHEHLMKYNLRFLWKAGASDGSDFSHFSQSYIRKFSNIPCYQLDRNKLEKDLITMNLEQPGYELLTGTNKLDIQLAKAEENHVLHFQHEGQQHKVSARWLVDSSGRIRKLAAQLGTKKKAEIKHSAAYFWVDGITNIEKLGTAPSEDKRKHPSKRELGHLPMWLATNHFMGEGFWFWVIPLQGRTSFGLVYDNKVVDPKQVSTQQALFAWLFERFPMFEAAFAHKEIIDFTVMHNYTHDVSRTIDRNRWAMTGESGRFTDPLYSPGGDLISIHNTLICDAIFERDEQKLASKISNYETMFQLFYKSFLPSYDPGYLILGDQEAFAMKYVWELAVYFGFFVFPFINDLLTERNFLIPYFRRLAALGDCNHKLFSHLHAFCQWKKQQSQENSLPPCFFDFTQMETLAKAETTFYEVGVSPKEALAVLDQQLANLHELARYIIAHTDAVMTQTPHLVWDRAYVESIDMKQHDFCPQWQAQAASRPASGETYAWKLDASVLARSFPQEPSLVEQVLMQQALPN